MKYGFINYFIVFDNSYVHKESNLKKRCFWICESIIFTFLFTIKHVWREFKYSYQNKIAETV